jgi:methylisocitrate lyase
MEFKKRKSLRELVAEKQVFCPCIYDCLSARTMEIAGFEAVLLSSGELTVSLGLCGEEELSNDQLIWTCERIVNSISVPLIVDAGGCGANPIAVYHTVRRLAEVGVAAITLDDGRDMLPPGQPFRGPTGTRGPRDLYPIWIPWANKFIKEEERGFRDVIGREEFLQKIRAANEAVKGYDCMVIARVEAYDMYGFNETIERCRLARELGCEMTTCCFSVFTEESAVAFSQADPGWKMWPDVTSVDGVPNMELPRLEELGFNLVTFHIAAKAAMYGMYTFCKKNFEAKNTVYSDGDSMGGRTPDEQFDVMGMNYKEMIALEESFKDFKIEEL